MHVKTRCAKFTPFFHTSRKRRFFGTSGTQGLTRKVRAPPDCAPHCALTADRGRNRSVVDRGRDLTQNLTLVDRAPALLAAMMESATIAEVDGSATETHDASQVSGAIGEGHGDLSDSNCATGRAMARRVGP